MGARRGGAGKTKRVGCRVDSGIAMDVISSIGSAGGSVGGYVIPFLFVLTVVVFFHELGHFAVARWAGVKVETFSIGFGHELIGWTDKKGTRWKIGWLPLGGYVKFFGDENPASTPDRAKLDQLEDEDRAVSFHYKPLPHRAAVVAAGPVANFILAIVIFAGLFTIVGQPVTAPTADQVQPDSPAAAAGFKPGDLVLAIDGTRIETFADMQRIVSINGGEELAFLVERAGTQLTLHATPQVEEVEDRFGNIHRIGRLGIIRDVGEGAVKVVRANPVVALWLGAQETWFIIERTMGYLWGIIAGREDASQLGGFLRIGQVSGQVATLGFAALLNITAILSVSIGLLNLFPVPMLDGGHLLYYGIEGVRGRPLNVRAQEYGFRIGLALVMMLMIFATWNDLVHLRVFEFLGDLLFS
mgnify:CR=1 FL=1